MSCAACGHEHRPRAKFCEECGAALGPVVAPGRPPRLPPPPHLAERILGARAGLQGERKPVTVLFADVQGSMALAEQVDAEQWHAMMNQFFAVLADGIHRFEGTISQYGGDGIMALFGAPLAHEDHAQRACYAALHLAVGVREYAQALRRERGLQFSVRMGLNSGEVVVGSIGDDLRMDYTAQGHTVGLASRMEQLCEPGRIYLTEHTAALVHGHFDLEDLGAFTIKGVREPLRVYALLGAGPSRTRLDIARMRGLSRFIGRDAELGELDAALAERAAGCARVVGIVADAGVGKSRLCLEFAARCRARGAAVTATHAVAHGTAVPYLPVLTLLRGLIGLDERDPAAVARQKIAGRLLLIDDAFKATLPLLFEFLGVPDEHLGPVPQDPETRSRLLVAACVALLRSGAGVEPAVMIVEDLHWLDAPSEAFLGRLIARLDGERVLPVLNFRPEYDDGAMQGDHYRRLELHVLPAPAVDELLRELLGDSPSLAGLAARLRQRAAGNPFFLEELVRSLTERGIIAGAKGAYRVAGDITDDAIPHSAQAVLAARIDRLTDRDKNVLQTAAVIGKQFAEPVLATVTALPAAVLATALTTLAHAGFVGEEAAYPVREYAFKHPLIQEVAYASQLGAQRTRLHAAVAAALGDDGVAPSAERAAFIAYHWEQAGDSWQAAQWHYRVARGVGGTDRRDTLDRLRHVIALLGDAPSSGQAVSLALEAYDNLVRAGSLAGMSREEGAARFAAGRALAERARDRAMLARLNSTYGEFLMLSGQSAAALEHVREATELAETVEDRGVAISIALDRAQTAFWSGRLGEALTQAEVGIQYLADSDSWNDSVPVGLQGEAIFIAVRGLCLSLTGRPRQGAAALDRALALAVAAGPLEGRAIAHQFRSLAALQIGDAVTGLSHARAGFELAARTGNPFIERMARANLGAACAFGPEPAEGVRLLRPFGDDIESGAAVNVVDWFTLPALAEAYRAVGDTRRACATARRAVEVARSNDALTAECSAQLVLVRALADDPSSPVAEIDAALQRVDDVIAQSGATSFRPQWHLARARKAINAGDTATAHRELELAQRWYAEWGMEELAHQAARELGGQAG